MLNNKALKALLAGCLASLILMSAVLPVLATDFRLPIRQNVTPQTFDERYHRLNIPAAAFRWNGVRTGGLPEEFRVDFDGYIRGGYTCLMAPAYFPEGAIVRSMFTSVRDNDAGGGMRLYLYRGSNVDGSSDLMGYLATSDPHGSTDIQVVADTSIEDAAVVYPDYSYYLRACIDSDNVRLYSVRIYYGNEVYLPSVIKN